MIPFRNIIIEGVDRLGKGTLIKGIQDQLGYFQHVHYQKPLDLACLRTRTASREDPDINKRAALRAYQEASFKQMFKFLAMPDSRFIMDRAHLGETVYAPRYRKYDGSYVFDLERQYLLNGDVDQATLLVLLHTSNWDFIKDDGESFNFEAKEEEQNDFVRAFEKSIFTYKVMLDVHNGMGGFVSAEALANTVCQAWRELKTYHRPILNVRWNAIERLPNMEYEIVRIAEQQLDPRKAVS